MADGNLDLHDIIFDTVCDIFIDAHFIGIFMERQAVLFCKRQYFFITPGNGIPVSFIEGAQLFAARS